MIEHRYLHRVRYRECDPMGVVYHAHYVDHFEAARTEALRAHGLPYRLIEAAGVAMPVIEMNVRFVEAARYDDLLEVHVYFPEPPAARIRTEYVTRRLEPKPANAIIARATVVLCFIDRERDRPVRAPESLRQVFDAHA